MIVTADQRFLLLPAPALDLALGRCCILQPLKILVKHQRHRPPQRRIAVISAGLMFG
jgi:hypothetical protein